MSKEEIATTPSFIMPKANADVVTSAFISMMTKLAAATKDTKRTSSPAPKKKGKDSNAAPRLIGPNPSLRALRRNIRGQPRALKGPVLA